MDINKNINYMNPNPVSSIIQKKYIYIFLILLLLVQLNNFQPLASLKVNSVAYQIHFAVTGLLYWIFAALLFYTAWTFSTKSLAINWVVAGLFCVFALLMMGLPFFIFHEMAQLDQSIGLLNAKADSLRKLGK
jgi:hypothetical protein